jgi:hypothetical protein
LRKSAFQRGNGSRIIFDICHFHPLDLALGGVKCIPRRGVDMSVGLGTLQRFS